MVSQPVYIEFYCCLFLSGPYEPYVVSLSKDAIRAMQIDYSHYQETSFDASGILWGNKIAEGDALRNLS